jgi:hypothetical protein
MKIGTLQFSMPRARLTRPEASLLRRSKPRQKALEPMLSLRKNSAQHFWQGREGTLPYPGPA